MQLPLQDFTSLVRTQAAAASASCRQLIDVTVGSVLRAVLEANAAVGLWMQWLIMEVLATTRAATSKGADLDSWVADFGLARLPAAPAHGQVTFGRATPGLGATVPIGAMVRTGTDASAEIFTVSADASNPAWTGGGYRLAASDVSVTVPVVAQRAGQSGNVLAGSVVMLASAIPGVDTVFNAGPMLGGLDAESDEALRSRFGEFLDSRTRATAQAIGFAILSLQQNVSYTIAERVDTAGAVRPGHFTVTVDDGTGAPSASFLAKVAAAIEPIRPLGSTFSVRAPLIIQVTIQAHVTGPSDALDAVTAAIVAFISRLPIGAPLIISRLYQVAYDADNRVSNVRAVSINSASLDLTPPSYGLLRPLTVSVVS